MAAAKSTAAAGDPAAKAKTTDKAADAQAAPTQEAPASPPEAPASPPEPKADEQENSASAGVKQRRVSAREAAATDRVPTQTFDYGDKPRELTPEQVEAQNGLPTFHNGGPDTSATNLAGAHVIRSDGKDSEYVTPEEDGFIAFIVANSKTATTIRVWSKGQAVKRTVYDHYQGKVASKARDAKILDPEDVLTASY